MFGAREASAPARGEMEGGFSWTEMPTPWPVPWLKSCCSRQSGMRATASSWTPLADAGKVVEARAM